MKQFKFLPLALMASALFSGAAQAESEGIVIGSVSSVISGFAQQYANPRSQFVTSYRGVTVGADIKDYFNRDGRISITGTAIGSPKSLFILKGNQSKVYGYMALHDSKKAYEYTTNAAGQVVVTEVSFYKIYPDLDPAFIKSNVPSASLLAVSHPVYSPMAQRQAKHIGPYNNEDVTKLESKPGSPYVFYLNISSVMSGSTPLNGVTKENMYRAWQSVADQYSMLNLNVTTNVNVYNTAKAASVLRTGIINFINQDGRSNAPLSAFGTTAAGSQYRNPSSGFDYGYGIGMTCAHEVGHQMGMNHDRGGTGGEYFEGIPAYQWGPIMGNYWQGGGWANQLFTWSKGEYNTATNFEDDLNIMNTKESVPYMADDVPTSKPLVVGSDGTISPLSNFGQIERTGDSDSFDFNLTTAGTLNLRIDPLEYLRMLDVDASIVNSSGAVVARSNLAVHRSAEFVNLSLPIGSYKVVIKGGAEGTPQNGFSNYSSLGFYGMKGTLTGGVIVDPNTGNVLTNGVAKTGQSGTTGTWNYYKIDVPAGKTSVKFNISGGNGDADLYARMGANPTTSTYGCKSDGATSVETCTISNPTAGTYYVGVYAYSAYSALSVTATH